MAAQNEELIKTLEKNFDIYDEAEKTWANRNYTKREFVEQVKQVIRDEKRDLFEGAD